MNVQNTSPFLFFSELWIVNGLAPFHLSSFTYKAITNNQRHFTFNQKLYIYLPSIILRLKVRKEVSHILQNFTISVLCYWFGFVIMFCVPSIFSSTLLILLLLLFYTLLVNVYEWECKTILLYTSCPYNIQMDGFEMRIGSVMYLYECYWMNGNDFTRTCFIKCITISPIPWIQKRQSLVFVCLVSIQKKGKMKIACHKQMA